MREPRSPQDARVVEVNVDAYPTPTYRHDVRAATEIADDIFKDTSLNPRRI